MKKKAQATLFVILGLVMLILVFFTMFMMISFANTDFEARAQDAVSDYLATAPINLYVTSCIEDATSEAVYEIFKYGGLDNNSFYDLPEDETFSSQELGVNALKHLNVGESELCGLDSFVAPAYPVVDISLEDLFSNYTGSSCVSPARPLAQQLGGFFGANNFSALCSREGNNIGATGPCWIFPRQTLSPHTLPNFAGGNNSFESRLEKSIINKTDSCVDFDYFEDFDGHNISRLDDPPTANINLERDGFSVTLTYPFSVALEGRVPVVTSYDFVVESDLRLTRFQSLMQASLAEESRNIFFNISNIVDLNRISFFDEFMRVNSSLVNSDDLQGRFLKFTDSASSVFGENVSTSTFIPARRPVLDHISYASNLSEFDIIVLEGQNIEIDPLGIDPDDQRVSYFYRGWRENDSVIFNFSRHGCGAGSRDFISFDQFYDCLDVKQDNPEDWSSSDLFQDTNRASNITTSQFDIGPRNFTVGVKDVFGLVDYQVLSVMVVEEPSLNLSVSTPFSDFPDRVVSIEDPFSFDASDYGFSDVYEGSVRSAVFEIFERSAPEEGEGEFTDRVFFRESLRVDGEEDVQLVLQQPLFPNIFNISSEEVTENQTYLFRSEVDIFSQVLQDTVTAEDEYEVQAVVCAPHRSSHDSFPYGSASNDFLNNHTCCLGSFDDVDSIEVAGSDYGCFDDIWFGTRQAVIDKAVELSDVERENIEFSLGSFSVTDVNLTEETDSNFNSVWTIDFERLCDGTRGNICGGDVNYEVVESVSCMDAFSGADPQCVAPSEKISQSALECEYTQEQTTFSSLYVTGGSNVCRDDFECSTPNGEYDDGGPRLCQATCDGEGACSFSPNGLCNACDVNQCGAECDADNLFDRQGNVCLSNCDALDCSFNSEQALPCGSSLESCFIAPGAEQDIFDDATCYFEVMCDQAGASYEEVSCNLGEFTVEGERFCRFSDGSSNPCDVATQSCDADVEPLADDEVCNETEGAVPQPI